VNGKGFGFMQFYGVDPDRYLEFFPDNVRILEGDFLISGEGGVVLAALVRDMLEETAARNIGIGDSILVTATNETTGTKIRELEVVGVYEFVNSSRPLELISFIGLEDARVLNGMTAITDIETGLTEAERSRLGVIDENDLFAGGDGLFGGSSITDESTQRGATIDFESILGDTSRRDQLTGVDETAWHYVLLKLEDGQAAARIARGLNRSFAELGMDLVAFEWIDGAGAAAQLTYGLKLVFNLLILLVAVVAVIIIMNTLVISVTERISEIGTMRAIGAQRRFVRRMILLETMMIAVAFGGIGIIAGMGVTGILGVTGIESSTQILQVFMGGPVLSPVVSASSVLLSFLGVIGAGLAASLYPASIALGIQPVTAMNQK
jgi:ABC-type lipoprotein release transport system permease subunit